MCVSLSLYYDVKFGGSHYYFSSPLFFSEFLVSNDKGNGGEWWPGFKIGGKDPVAPPTGDRPLFFFSSDFVANLKKKNYI